MSTSPNRLPNQKLYRVRYYIPGSSDPRQETEIQASSPVAARHIFELQYRGCRLSEMPQEIRGSR